MLYETNLGDDLGLWELTRNVICHKFESMKNFEVPPVVLDLLFFQHPYIPGPASAVSHSTEYVLPTSVLMIPLMSVPGGTPPTMRTLRESVTRGWNGLPEI